ncbi:MAG: hypothetical protein O2U61_02475 [Candidatus Bathyarchaeota archaeon]|nr:hypothetical protein [Candidatus Bathyarchaeota archaeon]
MEKLLQELLEKIEGLRQNQEKILSHLDESLVLPKFSISSSSIEPEKPKKEKDLKDHEEMVAVIMHSSRIRDNYNLAVTPQTHRILHYLRTGDPAAFNGLKRRD